MIVFATLFLYNEPVFFTLGYCDNNNNNNNNNKKTKQKHVKLSVC